MRRILTKKWTVFGQRSLRFSMERSRSIKRIKYIHRYTLVKGRAHSEKKGCSEPGVSCFQAIHKLDDWIYTEPTEESNYVVI
ncbi:unnamed protein product, partial [Mesorhabditis belari]|uniref:Uncharacterized protein n=1 Tax=Mesorhabditis belari TaxID=2138241 RepID=A0AAF3F8C9_9BILA